MADEAIVEYIRDNLAAGHSETALREHLKNHGWGQADIDNAFARSNKIERPSSGIADKPRRGAKPLSRKHTGRNLLILAGLIIIAWLGWMGYRHMHLSQPDKASAPVLQSLSTQTKQTNDISTVAGAVGQYAAANGVLPTTESEISGSLVLCNDVCDPLTSQVASLVFYSASNVKIMQYSDGLTVSNVHTIYLVPRAKCVNDQIAANPDKPRAMVLLYMRDSTPPVKRCVTM